MSRVPEPIPLPPAYTREWVAIMRLKAIRWLRDRPGTLHARQALMLWFGLTYEQLRLILACPAFVVCFGMVRLTEAGERAARAIAPAETFPRQLVPPGVRFAGEESSC